MTWTTQVRVQADGPTVAAAVQGNARYVRVGTVLGQSPSGRGRRLTDPRLDAEALGADSGNDCLRTGQGRGLRSTNGGVTTSAGSRRPRTLISTRSPGSTPACR